MMELTPPPPEGRHGITETEGLIMGFLCDHLDRELYQRDVEEVFCIRRSTASRFLQNLERDGMLTRQSVPQDARLKKLVPTEKAMAIHAEIAEKFQIAEALMTAGLTAEELEQFIATARKIQRNLLD
ncbi:MarR family transcriptional regulator [Pseudoflavonifractor sp. CLA-AP-H29]|uniref:MarR family transcriptional regulator n=1 Tax=Pseudoflavonifractor intestinihominis TaxID=3133171 RepID=A0ABV1E951_9FIRM